MFWQLLGTAGALCIVVCYWQVVSGKWTPHDRTYLLTNLAGALLLTISLCFNFNLGSMLIEFFWISISVAGLLKRNKIT
jgi:hypothetical protein